MDSNRVDDITEEFLVKVNFIGKNVKELKNELKKK